VLSIGWQSFKLFLPVSLAVWFCIINFGEKGGTQSMIFIYLVSFHLLTAVVDECDGPLGP
jgi:hypothetical protein